MCKFINLRASAINYLGDVATDKRGFTYFVSVAHEFRAMYLNFLSKFIRYRESSIHEVDFSFYYVSSFAPASDGNDTDAYHRFIQSEVNQCYSDLLSKKFPLQSFVDLYIKHAKIETGMSLKRELVVENVLKSGLVDGIFGSFGQ